MTRTFLVFLAVVLPQLMFGQSANYRAQGKYYSGLEQFENQEYESALAYIWQAKELLGGTNYKLQYLHILCLYELEYYQDAQTQMTNYFNLIEQKATPKPFVKDVEHLTQDETKHLTKLIDKIDEGYNKAKNRVQAREDLKRRIVKNDISIVDVDISHPAVHTTYYSIDISELAYSHGRLTLTLDLSFKDVFVGRKYHVDWKEGITSELVINNSQTLYAAALDITDFYIEIEFTDVPASMERFKLYVNNLNATLTPVGMRSVDSEENVTFRTYKGFQDLLYRNYIVE